MTPPYGLKNRRTKEPLDESERGEWKSWLKAQHSENEDHGIWFPLQMVTAAMKLNDACSLGENLWPTSTEY